MNLEGLEPDRIVTVSAVVPVGDDARQVFYKLPDGTLRERLVTRGNEQDISVATTTRPWAFDGDGEAFRLAAEAKRIDLAFLFDPMMAVHTSNVEPLPHQITAVYESMLPRQPLRYVLADDPGSGKTIMAGLYIRELIMRADANRVIVVAPGLMRRMVKEELLRFDGRPLFPERRAYTVNCELSDLEADLYERVTNYVKTEMGKADQLDGQRRGSVGFALTALQRRLASSPEAIFQSLKRRHGRLEQRLRETKLGVRSRELAEVLWDEAPEDDDDMDATEQESLEERLVDEASASQTVGELEAEILILQALQQRALGVVNSGQDKKWDELSRILQDDPHMRGPDGRLRKMIIFSEHRDTLNYLNAKIAGVLGNPEAIVTIHGGVHRDERRKIQEMFRADPEVRILVATEIAFWSDRWLKLREDQEAGKDVRLNLENVRRTVLDLEGRLESRKKELQAMRHVTSATPVALGGALVVPAGLLRKLKNETSGSGATAFSSDAAARRRIELLAMDAVRRVEEAAGCRVDDVSADKCGWDLTSYPPDGDGNLADPRHIEVKGRVKGADTITVTRNEILYALNQADKFILAIVLVAEDDAVEGPFYLRDPFDAEPGWGVSSWNIKIDALLERAEMMA
jgi:hypothetical protein